jgi:hypothetical protein
MANPPSRTGKSFAAPAPANYARPAPAPAPARGSFTLPAHLTGVAPPSRVPGFAPPPITTRPTPEFRAHHDIKPPDISAVSFRPAWLVRTRLLQLREQDPIDEAALDAACRWRVDHDRAHGRSGGLVGHYAPRLDGGTSGGREQSGLRLDALRRLREAATALGRMRALILLHLVVHDDSFRALGRLLCVNRETARSRAAEAIAALHCHQSGAPVPAETVTRAYRSPTRW